MMEPIPVGTLVDYNGSHAHGRYVITGHEAPREIPDVEVHYPDGVAYRIWREGVLPKFGTRGYMVSQVRRGSLTVISETEKETEKETEE